jgi:uncharacterized protein
MIVVSDTTVLSNLLHIEKLHLLQDVFKIVVVPKQVLIEIEKVTDFKGKLQSVPFITIVDFESSVAALEQNTELDDGEKAAIGYAYFNHADLLIIDEIKGRKAAVGLGLQIIGTIGILITAKRLGFIDEVKSYLDQLRLKGFWLSDKFYKEALEKVKEA